MYKGKFFCFCRKKKKIYRARFGEDGGRGWANRLCYQKDLTHLGISADKIGVYIPFSYAVTGNLIIVPKQNITPISGSSADIMKLVISGGVTKIEEEKES